MSVVTTRSGRVVKKPVIYEPEECDFVDDYKDEEYDSDDNSDVESIVTSDSEEEDDDDTSSLDSFIVDDEEEEDCD